MVSSELFPKAIVDDAAVSAVAFSLLGLTIEKRLKTSQNVTYLASRDGIRACVRVTPDPLRSHGPRLAAELRLLDSLAASSLEHTCSPIRPNSGCHATFEVSPSASPNHRTRDSPNHGTRDSLNYDYADDERTKDSENYADDDGHRTTSRTKDDSEECSGVVDTATSASDDCGTGSFGGSERASLLRSVCVDPRHGALIGAALGGTRRVGTKGGEDKGGREGLGDNDRVGKGKEEEGQEKEQEKEQEQEQEDDDEAGWCWMTAFHFAKGEPVDMTHWAESLGDRKMAWWCGKFLAEMHVICRNFAASDDGKSAIEGGGFRRFDSENLHSGVMKDYETRDDGDAALCAAGCGPEFGIVHGDFNVSNFFYRGPERGVSVFDFDQVHLSWFEYDLVAPIQTVAMLSMAGAPVSGEIIPGLPDPELYKEWVIEGYESVAGNGAVNRDRLERMIEMRYEFYRRFCARAIRETPEDHEMIPFCRYVNGWIDLLDAKGNN